MSQRLERIGYVAVRARFRAIVPRPESAQGDSVASVPPHLTQPTPDSPVIPDQQTHVTNCSFAKLMRFV